MSSIETNSIRYFYQLQGTGPPLVLLHGFTGSSKSWSDFLRPFTQRYQVVLLDLPGHGRTTSPEDPERYTMSDVSQDLIAIFQALHLSDINLLGYSMGGRLALYVAAHYPEFLNSLILESSSPGLATPKDRKARREADNQLADEILKRGIPAFVNRWQQHPLFETQNKLPDEKLEKLRRQRMTNSPLGLANSLRGMGTGRQPSLWANLTSIHLPVYLMAGEMDSKFAGIAHQVSSALPASELRIFPGVGHNIHLEKPNEYTSCVLDYVDRVR